MEKTETLEFEHRYITQLSGGERQRVVFARALAQEAPVLVLDEATSSLDINHAISLMKMATRRVREDGETVIAIMQDINLAASFCDYLIFLNNGKITAKGPVDEVLTRETLQTVFGVESKVYFEPYLESLQVVFKK
jgi:iron complex transport system ATP-binding protein